jgi:hypothetical protein
MHASLQNKCLCYPGWHVVLADTCQNPPPPHTHTHKPCCLAVFGERSQAFICRASRSREALTWQWFSKAQGEGPSPQGQGHCAHSCSKQRRLLLGCKLRVVLIGSSLQDSTGRSRTSTGCCRGKLCLCSKHGNRICTRALTAAPACPNLPLQHMPCMVSSPLAANYDHHKASQCGHAHMHSPTSAQACWSPAGSGPLPACRPC